jgi:hypothetical protein
VAAACFLGVALGIRAITGDWQGRGPLAQYSGTVFYASMVYAGAIVVWPRIAAAWAGAVATAFCWAVEAAQASGIPADLASRSLLARAALGVHFDWTDILWYPAGIVPLVAVDWLLVGRQRPVRPRGTVGDSSGPNSTSLPGTPRTGRN